MKLSVIVPVYNAEKYLENTINSILKNIKDDAEIILIDDGSKDNSGKIADNMTKLDSRVKVYHKENGGVSSARNLGMSKAQGEYITFVDADDIVCNNIMNSVVGGGYARCTYIPALHI